MYPPPPGLGDTRAQGGQVPPETPPRSAQGRTRTPAALGVAMAIGHISVRAHSRSRGHSMAAALAYRCGASLTCSRTGETFDYGHRTRQQHVWGSGFAGIDNPGPKSRAATARIAQWLADETEQAEDAGAHSDWHRANACIARDLQTALPCELTRTQKVQLAERFGNAVSERYNARVAWSVHGPDRRGDPRNTHSHTLLPSRNKNGEKLSVLNDRSTGGAEVKALRALWQDLANAALVEAGKAPTVYTGRRADANPQPTLGTAKTGRERRHRRDNTLPYEDRSVAEMCADGRSITGTGRRLERYVRDAEIQIEKDNERLIVTGVDADKVEPIFIDPGVAKTPVARTPRARRRRERKRAGEPVALPARSAADAGIEARTERAPRRKPRTRRAAAESLPVRRSAAIAEPAAPARQQPIEAHAAAPTALPVLPSTPIAEPAAPARHHAVEAHAAMPTALAVRRSAAIAEPAAPARQQPIEAQAAMPTVLPVRPGTTSVHTPAISQRAQWTPPQWLAGYSVERAAAEGLIQLPAASLPALPERLAAHELDLVSSAPRELLRPLTTGERAQLAEATKELKAQKRMDESNLQRIRELITPELAQSISRALVVHYAGDGPLPQVPGLEEAANKVAIAALKREAQVNHFYLRATRDAPNALASALVEHERWWRTRGFERARDRIAKDVLPTYSKQRARELALAGGKKLLGRSAPTTGRGPHER